MKPTKNILIGDVLIGSEATFLRLLVSAFPERGTLFLANFQVGPQQIDFLVVTSTHAGLLELKQLTGPVFGAINGSWELIDATGNRVPYAVSSNPYKQALSEAYALSDAMKAYRRQRPSVPEAEDGKFFKNFRTYVAIAPNIHPNSTVTTGDIKARVLSAREAVEHIRTTGHTSTWSVDDWRRFAIEHLSLRPVTLEEAIDPRTLAAANVLEQYRQRCRARIGTNLAPLINSMGGALYGETLVQRFQDTQNTLLVGPSGSTKTFHVHHAAMAMLDGDIDVPILLAAKGYRGGDFWSFLRRCLAPVFPGDPKPLLTAIAAAAARPVLFVDALNECSQAHRDGFLEGVVAFALQCDARTIITAQAPVAIPGLTAETLTIGLPGDAQKRQIYAFHAGLRPSPELDPLCGGFRNAYELTIAGRCHFSGGRPPAVPHELYDRYVAECLPRQSSAVTGALARHLAMEMGNRGSLQLSRHDCDAVAQRFLAEHQASLTLLDDLLNSPLMDATGDIVSFEHELLFTYLRSSALQYSVASFDELCDTLRLPRNQPLVEFILPRLTAPREIDAVLKVCEDVGPLVKAYDGGFGPFAQSAMIRACDEFTRNAIAELETIQCRFVTTPSDDGRLMLLDIEVRGLDALTSFEITIADVIASRADDAAARSRLLKLMDETETALRSAVTLRASEESVGLRQAWSEMLRLWVGVIRPTQMRGTLVVSNLKQRVSGFPRERFDSVLREELLSRALDDPGGTFALYVLLEELRLSDEDGGTLVTLVERAWATGIYYLRMTALFCLMNARTAVDVSAALQSRVAAFLDSIEANDLILSSMIVEAQSHFETIEAPVSSDDALAQMRATIEWNVPDELRDAFGDDSQHGMAYSLLSRIFEDVFQGAYWNAYYVLSEDERFQILTLAAGASNRGFHGSWIITELCLLDKIEALPAFRKGATAINLQSSFPQDETAVFVMSLYGFARYAEAPPTRSVPTSALERAWFVIADALFWAFHDEARHAHTRGAEVLAQLDGEALLAAASVLSDLHSARSCMILDIKNFRAFVDVWPEVACKIAMHGITYRDRIGALMKHPALSRDVPGFLVKTLGEIGDASAIPVLRSAMDDALIGRASIAAIRAIEAREVGIPSLT